jgi:hypothetical protein
MNDASLPQATVLPSGPAAAAMLAAGAGSATLGVLALAADASPALNKLLAFYHPSGALSGVTTVAILGWLGVWYVLERRWHGKQIELGRISAAAFALLVVGILLTFPPFMDLVQGK